DVVVEILLRPEDARERLALNAAEVIIRDLALQIGIEGVCLGFAPIENPVEIGEGVLPRFALAEPYADRAAVARRNGSPIDAGRLRAGAAADGTLVTPHDIVVKAVLV